MQRLKLFISSPGDVPKERLRAELIVDKLGADYNRFFALETYRWEYEPMLASGHFQDAIDPPSRCDIVVLIVWSRLGTPLPERTALREYRGMDGRAPVTGTEWEYEDALRSARERGTPDILAFRNLSPATVDASDAGARAQSLAQLDALGGFWKRHFADGGAFLAGFDAYSTLDEFSARLEQSLRKLIERRIAAMNADAAAPAALWRGAPFRGLESYEFEHAAIFHGRDALVGKAVEQLAAQAHEGAAFLLLSGASGSGKSSLVKAAIVPRLMKPQRIEGAAFMRRVVFRPTGGAGDLLLGFAEALTRADEQGGVGLPELLGPGQKASDFVAHLRASSGSLGFIIANALGRVTEEARRAGRLLSFEQAKLILVVDQLEELFTSARISAEDRRLFARLLHGLSVSGGVWIIATLRDDFWPRLAELSELAGLAAGPGRLDVLAPSPAELAEIIRKPLQAAGVSFETNPVTGLGLDAVLAEAAAAEPGVLPLLSFTLDALYAQDVAKAGGRVLTFRAYDALGGLEGAIAKRGDDVVGALPSPVQGALSRVLRALTATSSGLGSTLTARPAPLDGFPPGSEARAVVDALVEARLLVVTSEAGVATVRLAHEALISRWERARKQIAADRRDIETRGIVEAQHRRWSGAVSRERRALLLRDPDLANARDLDRRWGDELPAPIRSFVRKSISAARAAAVRRWIAASVIIFLLAALAAGSLGALSVAEGQRNSALIAQSRALTRDSRTAVAAGDATLGMQLALAALPRDLAHPDRPYLRDAMNALADAYANRRERARLEGHTTVVNTIAFSPDGARVVTASDDGAARIWSATDPHRSTPLIGHSGRVYSAAFSPDGARIVTASGDRTARVWDAVTGAPIGRPLALHRGDVVSAAFSRDGARIVTASWDGTARLWDARSGADLGVLPCSRDIVLSASFSPDGKTVLTVTEQGDAQIWDAASRVLVRTLREANENVNDAVFSPDGSLVATAGGDGVARLWDARSGALVRPLVGHTGRLLALAFSPDGTRVATAATDNALRIWSVKTGASERTLVGHAGPINAVAFSPDGRRLATASEDKTARLWDVATGAATATLRGHHDAVVALDFSPLGTEVATASRDADARLWSLEPAAFVAALPSGGGAVVGARFSADGVEIATASPEGASRVWDARDGAPLAFLGAPASGVYSAEFSSDGTRVVTASYRAPTQVWSARTGALLATLTPAAGVSGAGDRFASFSPNGRLVLTEPKEGPPRLSNADTGAEVGALTGEAVSAVFSPDGRSILTASADGTARVWDPASRSARTTLTGHAGGLKSAVFSPDGARIVTASLDHSARLWDAATGHALGQPMEHRNVVESAAFSADGKRAVTASLDHIAAVWDAFSGKPIAAIVGDGNYTLWDAIFSPDGARVATASDERIAAIWDAATGEEIATLRGHQGAVTHVMYSPDGKQLVTASDDGEARVWRAPPSCQALIDAAHAELPAELSTAEREQYFLTPPPNGRLVRIYQALQGLLARLSPVSDEGCR